jgi:hypothetical protein
MVKNYELIQNYLLSISVDLDSYTKNRIVQKTNNNKNNLLSIYELLK